MGARTAGAPGCALAPRGRPGYLRGRYLLAQPVPAAARPRPLPSQRRAPPPAPPAAGPGPPDASLAPPQPCRPEGAGLPGAQPTPAPIRLFIGRRRPVFRFPTPWLGLPRQLSGPPLSTSGAYVVSPPAFCLLLRALPFSQVTQFSFPLARRSFNHWPEVPVHFLGELSTSRHEEAVASLGAGRGLGGS